MDTDCTADRHGTTYHAYNKWKCRCPAAREAKRAHSAKWTAVLAARRAANPTPRKSPTPAWGTRTPATKLADYQRLRDAGFSHEYALNDVGWKHETYLVALRRVGA